MTNQDGIDFQRIIFGNPPLVVGDCRLRPDVSGHGILYT